MEAGGVSGVRTRRAISGRRLRSTFQITLEVPLLLVLVILGGCGPSIRGVLHKPKSSAPYETPTTQGTYGSTTTEPTPSDPFPPTTVAQVALGTYRLGETASFTASDGGSNPTAYVDLTINGVDNPSAVILPNPDLSDNFYPQPPPAGEHNVDLNVTVKNVGEYPVPSYEGGDQGVLRVSWGLNPTSQGGLEGNQRSFGLPSNCDGKYRGATTSLTDGQSVTGCVVFADIPDSVKIVSAAGYVEFDLSVPPATWNVS